MTISIIVPIFNAEKTLVRCINSILAQTISDFELILVDDGSSDGSLSLCRRFEQEDSRIIVISKENGGAGSARNAGICVARGEYLAFPDADDWVESDAYENLVRAAKETDADLIVGGAYFHNESSVGESDSQLKLMIPESFSYTGADNCKKNVMRLLPDSYLFGVPWNKLYKRNVIVDNNLSYKNLRRTQDAVFNLDYYDCVTSVCVISKLLYHYVVPYQEEKKYPKDYAYIRMAYYLHLVEKLQKWGVYDSNVKKYYDTRFFRHFWNAMCLCYEKQWNLTMIERKEYISRIMNNQDFSLFSKIAIVEEPLERRLNILRDKDVKGFFHEYRVEKVKSVLNHLRYLPNRALIRCLGENNYDRLKNKLKRN